MFGTSRLAGVSLLAGPLPSEEQCWLLLSHSNREITLARKAEG